MNRLRTFFLPFILTALATHQAGAQESATQIRSVYVIESEIGVIIGIQADGDVLECEVFTLKDPPRIVFDLVDIQSPYKKLQTVSADSQWLEQIRYYSHPNKLRIVLDIEKPFPFSYRLKPIGSGLQITISQNVENAQSVDRQ